MKEIYRVKTTSKSKPESIVQGDTYRITVLTESLLRLGIQRRRYILKTAPARQSGTGDFETPKFRLEKGTGGNFYSHEASASDLFGRKIQQKHPADSGFCRRMHLWQRMALFPILCRIWAALPAPWMRRTAQFLWGTVLFPKMDSPFWMTAVLCLLTEDGWVTPAQGKRRRCILLRLWQGVYRVPAGFLQALRQDPPCCPRFALGKLVEPLP